MGMTIGIDLGTTNSVTALKKINVSAIRNAEGFELTPSCVTAIPHSDGASYDFVVGHQSRDLLKQYPLQTIQSVKRLMGRDFEDLEVQSIITNNRVSYAITTDSSEPGAIRISLGGKMQTPEMISGIILNKLIRDGEAQLSGKISQAVVTVPAYFSDRQKFATRAACDYAGIKLLRLLSEPTAAALSFGLGELDSNESKTIMVFDLGGGTFDISVLSFSGGSFMEVTKGGDMWLGGDNIDSLLVDHVFAAAEKSANCKPIRELVDQLSPADKARFLVEIKEKAEAAKIALSSEQSATIEMFGILKDEQNKLIDIDVTIERPEFDALLAPIVKRVSQIAKQILHEIRFESDLIDTVLMVGGSSLVPAIQDELRNLFGADKVLVHPRPMLAIAEGAALMAAKMTSQSNVDQPFSMMHSTSHDYYLQLANGKKHLLVARNTPLPITVEEKLEFSHEDQTLARLRVLNEVDGVLDTVGELWFHKDQSSDYGNRKKELTKLMLRFSVDEDNIITMKAWSLKNAAQCVEAQIARGGLAAKLYNDLEKTLSDVVAHCRRGSIENDVLKLSRAVIATILSVSDPVTGETRVEQKQKAQNQINTLKSFPKKDLSPVSMYEFACTAQAASEHVLSGEENDRFKNMIEAMKQAVEHCDDAEKFTVLEKELEDFYDDVSIASTLGHAEDAALFLDAEQASAAKQIRNQAKIVANLYRQQNEGLMQSAENALDELVYSWVSYDSVSSGRFDRDVTI